MYVMCDPWCYTWLYVTGECILHVTVRYMRLYVTFELCCMWLYVTCDYMLCVNVWYMRLYVTCDCMVYLNVCYMWRLRLQSLLFCGFVEPTCHALEYRDVYIHAKSNCTTREKVKHRRCNGSCGNDFCCQPKKIKSRKVRLFCPNGTHFVHDMPVIRKCFCKSTCNWGALCGHICLAVLLSVCTTRDSLTLSFSLSLFLSFFFSLSLSLSLSLTPLFVSMYLSLSMSTSVTLSIWL